MTGPNLTNRYPSCQHLRNNGSIPRVRIPDPETTYAHVCSDCYRVYMGNSNRFQQTFVRTQTLAIVAAT